MNTDKKILLMFTFTMLPFIALAEIPRITNVHFEMNDTIVVIQYDITALKKNTKQSINDAEEFNIVVILRKENEPGFSLTLTYVTGDVGKGRWSGKNKKIFWDIRKEFPNGIEGADYYIEIRGEPVAVEEEGNIYTWLGIGASAVVAGGIAAYFIISGSNSGDKKEGFPMPPGRPK